MLIMNDLIFSGLRLDLDPDIVAAMDEDFNYDDPENELEDNFMELAMCGGANEGEEECSEEEYDDDNQSQVGYASDNQWSDSEDGDANERKSKFYDNEDAKSRFSQYSMSSSIIRRSNGLSLLDDKFEKVLFFIIIYSSIILTLVNCYNFCRCLPNMMIQRLELSCLMILKDIYRLPLKYCKNTLNTFTIKEKCTNSMKTKRRRK